MKSKRFLFALLTLILMILISVSVSAHSGKTDAYGGHNDNNNVSGLGYYHFHHGYPPHLHEDGVCPYSANTISEPDIQEEVPDFGDSFSQSDTTSEEHLLTNDEMRETLSNNAGVYIPRLSESFFDDSPERLKRVGIYPYTIFNGLTGNDILHFMNAYIEEGYYWGYFDRCISSNQTISSLESKNGKLQNQIEQQGKEIEQLNNRYGEIEAVFDSNFQLLRVYQVLCAVLITVLIFILIKHKKAQKTIQNLAG